MYIGNSNDRRTKFMSHSVKLLQRVLEQKLRKITIILQNKFGLTLKRSIIDVIFLFRQQTEIKYWEKKYCLYIISIDLKKAYNWMFLDDTFKPQSLYKKQSFDKGMEK